MPSRARDAAWAALTDGGEEVRCGWLKDRYGLSWQICPSELGEVLGDADPERAERAMRAMLAMVKIDIAAIRAVARRVTVVAGPSSLART